MTWMQTASGKPFDLLNPREEDVDPNDIIHALARISRFSGATIISGPLGAPYVVLQHCALVMDILDAWGAPPAVIREGGWHECDEPYTGDLTRPVQEAVRSVYRTTMACEYAAGDFGDRCSATLKELAAIDPLAEVRARVGRVARARLGLPAEETPIVKRADNVALAIEQRDLMAPCARDWQLAEYAPRDIRIKAVLSATQIETDFRAKMRDIEERIERA